MKRVVAYAAPVSVAVLLAASAFAATRPKTVTLESSQFFEKVSNGKTIRCGYIGGRWIPGVLVRGGAFASRAAQIRAVKKDITLASSETVRVKLEAKLSKLQKAKKAEAPVCNAGPATPTPTATPVSQGCYDSNRVTSCFGIPEGVSGKESEGETLFNSYCLSCHNGSVQTEPRDMTYSQINSSFTSVPDMNLYIGTFSVDQVADLTAFLNRYNPDQ